VTGTVTFIPPLGYYSPWDIWERPNMNVPYEIFNNVPGLTMNVRAYIGLAYFDDFDDGLFYDPQPTFPGPPQLIDDLSNGNYPNLYANNQEIGNLLLSRWIPAEPELIIRGANGAHCPVWDGNGPGYNPNGWYFDLPTATPQEKQLLSEYGKVFFYEVEVQDGFGTVYYQGILQVDCETLNSTDPTIDWEVINSTPGFVPNQGYLPSILSYYFNATNPVTNYPSTCDSREIVYSYYFDSNSKATPFTYNGNKYYVDLTMTAGHPMWLSARLNLSLRQIL